MLRAQAERARERIRWREAQEAAAAQGEEEQRRADKKQEKYGPSWSRGASGSGRPAERTDPLGYFEVRDASRPASDDYGSRRRRAHGDFRRMNVGFFPPRQIMGLSLEDSDSLTDDQVKSAFRAAALKWHPDRHRTGA